MFISIYLSFKRTARLCKGAFRRRPFNIYLSVKSRAPELVSEKGEASLHAVLDAGRVSLGVY